MEEVKEQPKLLRTVLRSDVYNRLLNLAQALETGRGHWDFGVAIERLLDEHQLILKLFDLDERMNMLERMIDEGLEGEKKTDNPLGLIGKRFKESDKNGKD